MYCLYLQQFVSTTQTRPSSTSFLPGSVCYNKHVWIDAKINITFVTYTQLAKICYRLLKMCWNCTHLSLKLIFTSDIYWTLFKSTAFFFLGLLSSLEAFCHILPRRFQEMSNSPSNMKEQLCKVTLQEYMNCLGFFQMLVHHIPAGNKAVN